MTQDDDIVESLCGQPRGMIDLVDAEESLTPTSLLSWAKQSAERPIDRSELKAHTLPDGEHEGTAKHPFPVTDRALYKLQVQGKGVASLTHKAQVGRIKLDVLVGIQGTVNRERLAMHLKDPALIPQGARAHGHGALIDAVIVVKLGGRYFLHDGHHRAAAAHLRGDKDVRCRLVDLDAPTSTGPRGPVEPGSS